MEFYDRMEVVIKNVVVGLQQELVDRKINASGRLSDSIKYEMSQHYFIISMNKYGSYVDSGTGPAKSKSGPGFYEQIKEWVSYKGIDPGAAWAIYQKILKEGIPKDKNKLGWIKIEERLLNLDEEILKGLSTYIDYKLTLKFKKMFI